jgi:hypothetical protein
MALLQRVSRAFGKVQEHFRPSVTRHIHKHLQRDSTQEDESIIPLLSPSMSHGKLENDLDVVRVVGSDSQSSDTRVVELVASEYRKAPWWSYIWVSGSLEFRNWT